MTVALTIAVLVALVAVAGLALATAMQAPLERASTVATQLAETLLVLNAIVDVARVIGGRRPDELVVHLGYVLVSVTLIPILVRPLGDEPTDDDIRGRELVLALAAVAVVVVVLRPAVRRLMPSPAAGRVLVAAYTILAIAAGARSAVQLSIQFSQAPLAYLLSAAAAVVYLVAAIALRRPDQVARRVAAVSMSVELAGVLAVGTLTLAKPGSFPDQTVWSTYGEGYGFVPLVLPVLGLLWLRGRAPH